MSLKVGELYGELKLDRRPFEKGLSTAEGQAKGWAGRVGGILGGAAGALVKWGSIAGGAAAGGAFMLANSASDLNETLAKTEVVFGDLGDDVKAWADDSADALGMSRQQALGAAATYGNLFQAMKIGRAEATEMSTGLVDLAADLASFNNQNPEEVLDALRAGVSGETEPLKRLGVNLNQARIEAKALEMGLWDGNGAIDAAAKGQATYALVLEDTTLAQGDFARTSDGMANQQRIAAAKFGDAVATIGQAFVPIFEAILPKVAEALEGFSAWVTGNMPTIQAVIETVLGAIGVAFGFLTDVVFPLVGEAIGFIVDVVIPAFAAAFDGVSNGTIPVLSDAIAILTGVVIPALMAIFQAVVGWVVANWPLISSVVGQVAGAVGTAFGVIRAVIEAVWPIVEAVAKVLFPILGAAASVLLGALDGTFKLIGGAFEVMGAVFETVVDLIRGAWRGLTTVTRNVWNGLGKIIKGAINVVIGVINGFIGFINGIQIHIPSVGVGPVQTPAFDWNGLNLGKIPYLARGTTNWPGGMAMLGEKGPELAYLPQGANVMPADLTAALTGSGRGEVHIHVQGAPAERLTERGIAMQLRRAEALAS